MAIFLELFNWAILISLIIFSAWSFYLQYKADRVTTTKDLLLAYVTGGALAVVTMVFGVTGDIKGMTTNIEEATDTIIETSASIKQDTVSIRTTLGGGIPPTNGPSGEDLAQLFAVNQQQTEALSRVLGILAELQENPDQPDQHLSIVDDLAELFDFNQQQNAALKQLLAGMADLQNQSEQTNKLLESVLEGSGINQEIPTRFSNLKLFTIKLDLICSSPQPQPQPQTGLSFVNLSPRCVIKPSE